MQDPPSVPVEAIVVQDKIPSLLMYAPAKHEKNITEAQSRDNNVDATGSDDDVDPLSQGELVITSLSKKLHNTCCILHMVQRDTLITMSTNILVG